MKDLTIRQQEGNHDTEQNGGDTFQDVLQGFQSLLCRNWQDTHEPLPAGQTTFVVQVRARCRNQAANSPGDADERQENGDSDSTFLGWEVSMLVMFRRAELTSVPETKVHDDTGKEPGLGDRQTDSTS